jgi:hypothetical protein
MFRLVVAAARAGRDQRRNRSSLSLSRTRSPQPVGMRDRRGGGGCAGGLSSGRRRSSGSCLPGAISSRPGPDPRIRSAGRARKHRRADLLLPASQGTGLLPAVCAQTCGSLVRNGAEPVYKQWKCWGFRRAAATMTGPLPGRARVASCACRENRYYPHTRPQ